MSAAITAAAPAKPGETTNSRSGTGDSIASGMLVIGTILPVAEVRIQRTR